MEERMEQKEKNKLYNKTLRHLYESQSTFIQLILSNEFPTLNREEIRSIFNSNIDITYDLIEFKLIPKRKITIK